MIGKKLKKNRETIAMVLLVTFLILVIFIESLFLWGNYITFENVSGTYINYFCRTRYRIYDDIGSKENYETYKNYLGRYNSTLRMPTIKNKTEL